MRVLVVDDHVLFRQVFIAALRECSDLAVVGEASDARTALALIERARPDVVTLDAVLEGESGIAATRELRKLFPWTAVLILTGYAHLDQAQQAFANGALGYASKLQPLEAVIDAIRTVGSGREYIAPQLREAMFEARMGMRSVGPLEGLSRREREVFQLAARGYSNRGIAQALTIALKTVETHRAKINRKLGTHSTSDLVRVAARHGLPL